MKNIFLLPTPKPSRLWVTKLGNLTRCHDIKPIKETLGNNVNIYITDNSEIKEGDWVITNNDLLAKVITELAWHFINSKKIILTTDQYLIKDGIQSIDDEFLGWFVKNSSCESVEIANSLVRISGFNWKTDYKIIIPKEELKQRLEKYSERFDNKDNEIVKGIFNPDTWGRRMVKEEAKEETEHLLSTETNKKRLLEDVNKQETLEEVAERLTKDYNGNVSQKLIAKTFITVGAKWQQEKLYSEEEVLVLLHKRDKHNMDNPNTFNGWLTPKGWFEQFKKK